MELQAGKDLVKGTEKLKTGESLPTALVTGRVYPLNGNQIISTVSGMPAVIQRSKVTEFRVGNLMNNW